MNAAVAISPPLKWAGGKTRHIDDLEKLWRPHAHRRLVEPFAGSMAVSLGLRPAKVLLNDKAPGMANFYRCLQCGLVPDDRVEMRYDRALFEKHRARFNVLLPTLGLQLNSEAATLLYYLNRTCFNGLFRVNASGQFNVPFGKYKSITYRKDFSEYASTMKHWRFSDVDFEKVEISSEDFVYADPPYDDSFNSYTAQTFEWTDQVRLVDWLDDHTGPVVISNSATSRIVKLYESAGFKVEYLLDVRRSISCTGDRSGTQEILAMRGLK